MSDPVSSLGAAGQNRLPTQTLLAAAAPAVDLPGPPAEMSEQSQVPSAQAANEPLEPMTLAEAEAAFKEYLENLPSNLKFQQDKESGYVIFKVVNPVTHEVIRQYPPDEMVKMARFLRSAARQERSGIFLDKKL